MVRKTARALSIDESVLLENLREQGFPARKKDVVEALEMLECVYDAETQRFYLPREFQTMREGQSLITASPDPGDVVAVGKECVFHLVASYLLGSSYDENGKVIDGARFLPDPSEPTTDLEELAKEETKVEGQKQERMQKRDSIYDLYRKGEVAQARMELGDYFSLLEQHLPELVLPGKEDASQRQEYAERFFAEAAGVRGELALGPFLIDLEQIALEGVADITTAFVESAPTLYKRLSVTGAHHFVGSGLEKLREYKNDPSLKNKSWPAEVAAYFALRGDLAQQAITNLMILEQEQLLPAYAAMKKELGRVEETAESLRKALEENLRKNIELGAEKDNLNLELKIEKDLVVAANARADDVARRYGELDQKYTTDATALEQEREKSARLEDACQGINLGYKAATQRVQNLEGQLAILNAALVDTKTSFDKYKTEAAQRSRKRSKFSGLTGLAVGAFCALVATSYDFSSGRVPTPSKPVPAVITPAVPAPASGYDPQGKNLKQLEKDFYTFIDQPRAVGEELTNLGPGCLNVLGQVYDKMKGTPEGKDYFLNSMTVSNFCNGIPEDKLVNLSSGGRK